MKLKPIYEEVLRPELNGKPAGKKPMGLGDLVEKLVKPVAKVLGLPCLTTAGTLRPESPCAARRDALNRLTQGGQANQK